MDVLIPQNVVILPISTNNMFIVFGEDITLFPLKHQSKLTIMLKDATQTLQTSFVTTSFTKLIRNLMEMNQCMLITTTFITIVHLKLYPIPKGSLQNISTLSTRD